jgi:AcrR family transcriptional regulator
VPSKSASTKPVPLNGNRRNPHTHAAIIRATLSLVRRMRYSNITIESIAADAGVGKATVYRWWPSKGAVVAEAISSTLIVDDPPETGDLRADLIAAVEVTSANYANSPGADLLHALASDIVDDPALLESFLDDFVLPRRAIVAKLLNRGIEEGRLPSDCDVEVVMDMWAGATFYGSLFRKGTQPDDLATKLVDMVLGQALTDEPH